MTCWGDVEVDFGGEETINFGPRVESGTALYQVETHATISPNGAVTEPPFVIACATREVVFVSGNCQLNVFADNCRRYVATLNFSSNISALGASEGGEYVAVGEQNGTVHLFDGSNSSKLFSHKVEEPSEDVVRTIREIAIWCQPDAAKQQIFILTGSGKIHVFGMNMTVLCEAAKCKDYDRMKSLQAQIDHVIVDASQVHCDCVNNMLVVPTSGDIVTTGSGETGDICLWKKECERFVPRRTAVHPLHNGGISMGKSAVSKCGEYLIVLDSTGCLSFWSFDHFFAIWACETLCITDFSIVDDAVKGSDTNVMALTRESDGSTQVMIFTIPTMCCQYSVRLDAFAVLASCSSALESFYLIEGESDGEGDGSISRLRVRSLTEALPESRMMRMLGKRQFLEAEEFAKQFELDVQPIHKAKASFLIDQSWNAADHKADFDLDELKSCINSIVDDDFVVDCCISAALPTLESMRSLLEYTKTRIKKKTASNASFSSQLNRITEAAHRLGTFQVIFGGKSYSSSKWEQFRKVDMFEELNRRLQRGRMHAVSSIWSRHLSDFQCILSRDLVVGLLSQIPENTPSDHISPWLSTGVVPYAVQHLPEALPGIATWIEERAKTMEILEPSRWPRNALEFCELLSSTFKRISACLNKQSFLTPDGYAAQVCNLSVSYSKMKAGNETSDDDDAFTRLQRLCNELGALCELHEKYNCRLTLAGFQSESVESITYRMLDRVIAVELIPDAIQKTLRPYIRQHNLKEDQMLYQYVDDLSQRYSCVVSSVGFAPWEAKAIEVIRCIKDLDMRCLALLNAMASAYVPWNPDLEALVKETLEMEGCPRVKEIQEKCQMVELKKLLINYGLRNFSLRERDSAEWLAYYILSQDQPTAVQDALHIAAFYSHLDEINVYLFRAKFLVERGRAEDLLELLKGLPPNTATRLGESLVSYTKIIVSGCGSKERKALFAVASCGVIRLLMKLKYSDEEQQQNYAEILNVMENISLLQVEFGIYLSVEEYRSDSVRADILKQHAAVESKARNTKGDGKMKAMPNGTKGAGETKKCTDTVMLVGNAERKLGRPGRSLGASLNRLAELLNVGREETSIELAQNAVADGQFVTAIDICKDLYNTLGGTRAGLVLLKIAHALCHVNTDDISSDTCRQLPLQIHEIARLAVSTVCADMLADGLQLCRITRLAVTAWNQCESGEYQSAISESRKSDGVAQDLPCVDDLFVEDGLVMDSSKILPQVFRIVTACLPVMEYPCVKFAHNRIQSSFKPLDLSVLESLLDMTTNVTDYLRENAQVELACSVATESVTMMMECVACHPSCMDQPNDNRLSSLLLKHLGRFASDTHEMIIGNLQKIFLSRCPDLALAMAYLCAVPKQVSFDCLRNLAKAAGFQYKRAGFIAQVGLAFCALVVEAPAGKVCQQLADNSRWGYQLAKLKVSFRDAFRGDKKEKSELLSVLVQNEFITISDLLDYCATFRLDEDESFLDCLRHLMVPDDADSGGNISVKTLPVAKAIGRAKSICAKIEKTEDLLKTLEDILNKLDPCDYEWIEFVLSVLQLTRPSSETTRNLQLISCLKTYNCKTSPGGKLPFHSLVSGNHWNVITPELNADTVESWLSIGAILGLQQDVILATAIRNIVEKYLKDKQTAQNSNEVQWSWKEDSTNARLHDVISTLLMKISSCELAIATAVWIIKNLPVGAEKVFALKCCVTMAQKWQAACPEGSADREKAQKTYTEHSAMYRRLLTEQILHTNDLGEVELLSLSGSPAKLIFKLYEHKCITSKRDPSELQSVTPNIHSVANSVASANRVDIEKIRTVLLNQWLPSSAKQQQESADVTMMAAAEDDANGLKDEDEDELSLIRVIYLLQCRPVKMSVLFLLNFAYNVDATTATYQCRVRALRCVFALADDKLIKQLIPMKDIAGIRKDIKVFLYLAQLERLGMPQTLESFEKISKEGLVRTIWRNHNHDVDAISTASDICLDFRIVDEQLWSCIIQRMLSFQCYDRLCNLLDRLSAVPEVWRQPFIETVIANLISAVLGNAGAPPVPEKLGSCLHLLSVVCRSPTAVRVDVLKTLIKEFERLELTACAIGCALLLPPCDSNQTWLNNLLNVASKAVISEQIFSWTKGGNVVPLGDLVLEHVDGKQGELLDSTVFLTDVTMVKNNDETNRFSDTTVFE